VRWQRLQWHDRLPPLWRVKAIKLAGNILAVVGPEPFRREQRGVSRYSSTTDYWTSVMAPMFQAATAKPRVNSGGMGARAGAPAHSRIANIVCSQY